MLDLLDLDIDIDKESLKGMTLEDIMTAHYELQGLNSRKEKDIFEVGNKYLKQKAIIEEKESLEKKTNNPNQESDMIITDYFTDEIEGIGLFAKRVVNRGPEKVGDKYDNWRFKGICSYKDLNKLDSFYSKFIEKYKKYEINQRPYYVLDHLPGEVKFYSFSASSSNSKEHILTLEVICGMILEESTVKENFYLQWQNKGVDMRLWGYDKEGNYVNNTDVIIKELAAVAEREEREDLPTNINDVQMKKASKRFGGVMETIFGSDSS